MNTRPLVRSIVAMALVLIVLAGVFVTLDQIQSVRAGRSLTATDYTVGGPCGATIQACINNPVVVNGDRILIPAGIYTESLTLNKAVSLIGAEADTTIVHAVVDQRVITVTGSVITASIVISGLTFTGGYPAAYNSDGGGILLTSGAQPLIQSVVVANNYAYYGGGIYADSSSRLMLVDAQILSNTAVYDGGGVGSPDAATLINSRFENNQADSGGGVVASALTLTNIVFVGNTAAFGSGGGVLAGTVNAVGGRFENNAAKTYGSGGGVYANTLSIVGTSFISNTAYGQYGGGAFAYEKATVLNGYFENNRAVEGSGGGLSANNLTAANTIFMSNTASSDFGGNSGYGGGVSAGVPTLIGNHLEHNEAALGGGLFARGAQTIIGTEFISNIAYAGGGLFSIDNLVLTGTVFTSNSATDGGAISQSDWYGASPSARIVNSILARNVASGNGAGVYLSSPGQATILHTTIADVGLNPRQAIAVISGTVGITNTIIASHTIGISQTAGTVYENYNLFFGNTTNKSGTITGGTNDIIGNPQFVNPTGNDYHLGPGSAAIDKGIYVGVNTDIEGNSRLPDYGGLRVDLGAYEAEYQGVIYSIYLPEILKNQ